MIQQFSLILINKLYVVIYKQSEGFGQINAELPTFLLYETLAQPEHLHLEMPSLKLCLKSKSS